MANLVACTARGGSRIALTNVFFFVFFFLFGGGGGLSFFMSDSDQWPEKGLAVSLSSLITQSWPLSYKVETFTLSRKPLNFACIEIILQVTISVGIYFLSSLGRRCSVYVHLNSIRSVWGWKFILIMILVALLHCRRISACTVQIYCPKIRKSHHNGINDH